MMRSGKRIMNFDVDGIRVNCPRFDKLWLRTVEVWPLDGFHDRSHLTEGKSTETAGKSKCYLLKYLQRSKRPPRTPCQAEANLIQLDIL
jgi:hypothetical protein